jgi:hypothetical protein
MSLKLVPPREGRSQHWRIRGTIKGQYVDESTGVSSQARAEEIRIKRENELLDYAIFGAKATTTFTVAAVSYLESRQPKGMQRYAIAGWNENSPCLMKDFGETLVNRIDQAKVNDVIAQAPSGQETGHDRPQLSDASDGGVAPCRQPRLVRYPQTVHPAKVQRHAQPLGQL